MAAQEEEYGTLPPDEATDSDDVRNADGDEVVDPPEDWQGSDKFGMSSEEAAQGESLDDKLAAEVADTRPEQPARDPDAEEKPDVKLPEDDTPEDGSSFFPVVR
ncbi:hypothetical protein [Mycolicibacterium cosmeticum]|uniref:hypothetical protein n=1 Tax=Mycolicibacterium cosmeticum TaxID=258533 RepID=UPI0032046B00